MRKLPLRIVAVSTLAILAAACGGDDTTAPITLDGGSDGNVLPDGSTGGDSGDSGGGGDVNVDSSDSAVPPTIYSHLFNGAVESIRHDGTSWYLGGRFYAANVAAAPHLLALDTKGAPITACALNGGFDGPVDTALQAGGSVYLGGNFRHYQGAVVDRIAKLDATTCALDTTFSPANLNGFDAGVTALATSGTSLYVAGSFGAYKGVANSSNNLAKLDLTSGAIDTTFSPPGAKTNGFDAPADALIVVNGALYVGGQFGAYKGVANSANGLAKVDPTSGAIDTTFSPPGPKANGVNGNVRAFATSGTALYVGGQFTAHQGVPNSANRLAKIDLTSGAIDTTFSPVGAATNGFTNQNGPGSVNALAVSGGALYVGGAFTAYKGVNASANHLAKLDVTTGVIDTTFSPVGPTANGTNGNVNALAVSGTALIVGGQFGHYRGPMSSAHNLAKVDLISGAQDTAFMPANNTVNGFERSVQALSVSGNTIWTGGNFWTYAGYSANAIAKLDDATYALDTTFGPANGNGFDADVLDILVANGSVYAAGVFNTYRGVVNSAFGVAKLDVKSGALDTTFGPSGVGLNGFNGPATSLATSGTSIYVGGQFTDYKGVANSANFLAKLDWNSGAIDATFSPVGANTNGFNLDVFALATSGTSLYVGGDFASYRGVAGSASRMAKLDLTSGALDTTFSPPNANGFDATVESFAVAGNVLYVGGAFNNYKNVNASANSIAKLDATTGAIDVTFSPVGANANGFDADVLSMVVVGNSVYCGGAFNNYRGVNASANSIAKLDTTSGMIDTAFSPVGALTNGFDNDVLVIAAQGSSLFTGGRGFLYRGGSAGFGGSMTVIDQKSGALR